MAFSLNELLKPTPAVKFARAGKKIAELPNRIIAKALSEHAQFTTGSLATRAVKDVTFRRFRPSQFKNLKQLTKRIEELPDEVFETIGLSARNPYGQLLAKEVLTGLTNPIFLAAGIQAGRALRVGRKAAHTNLGSVAEIIKQRMMGKSQFEDLI